MGRCFRSRAAAKQMVPKRVKHRWLEQVHVVFVGRGEVKAIIVCIVEGA